jgi:hypothetical protein
MRVCDALTSRLGVFDFAGWNDRDETTGEDVILVLKRAAEDLRS